MDKNPKYAEMGGDEEKEVNKAKRYKDGTYEIQQRYIDKLMKNPEKEFKIPSFDDNFGLKPPPEFVKTFGGSSAGAGSGEFHVYRHLRRKEFARQSMLKREKEMDEKLEAFQKRKEMAELIEKEKTEKRRQKRAKRKRGKTQNKDQVGETDTNIVKDFKMKPNLQAMDYDVEEESDRDINTTNSNNIENPQIEPNSVQTFKTNTNQNSLDVIQKVEGSKGNKEISSSGTRYGYKEALKSTKIVDLD
ncbi:hypothetical protein BB559_005258 [Furculomyces boomerangus]|uniref:Uncharacterized protein n=1 Tax=Furculomyces boomerangus TaxID=61424 RepID=A0A2T9Y9P4_9FUNG|nr:hypothetical protein BB559_005258 [Furculomyces boomerangus]